MSSIPTYIADYEGAYPFVQIGTITSAQAALAVTARDNASVDDLAVAKKVIWRPDQGTAAAILRFRTDGTEDQAPVIQVYAAKGADYYTRIATLTLAQGTQDWSGGHFIDEITLSNEAWAHGIRADSVTDEVGRVVFNTGGFDRFLFIASTLAVTTVHIDIARLDKQIDHGIEIHSAILVLADNMTMSDVVSAISNMQSVLSDATSIQIANDDLIEAGIRSGFESALSAIDETDSVHSALSGIVIDAVDLVTVEISDAISHLESTLSNSISGLESVLSTCLEDVEAATNLVQSAVDSVHSVVLAATIKVSTSGGTEKLTIPADPFQVAGAAQACREVIIYCPSANAGTIYLNIGGVAGVNDLPLHEDVWLSIPINNTNLLNFFGAAADVVHLLWRN